MYDCNTPELLNVLLCYSPLIRFHWSKSELMRLWNYCSYYITQHGTLW